MLQLSFTEEEIQELDYQRYHHPHPRVLAENGSAALESEGVASSPNRPLRWGL